MNTRFQKLVAETKMSITEIDLATYKQQSSSARPRC
jgi:hypothetical protein